jgi:S1-C subfamily serine protease
VTTTRFALLLWALILAAPCAYAQRAPDPSAATVLIRVIGDVHVEIDELGLGTTRAFDRTGVQLSSGSGFVVSSYGYIVTANHVVTEQQLTAQRGGATVRARFVPTRFEVALPKERNGDAVAPLVASIVATDRAADLALLFVTGTLPYVALGDSAALERGQQVQVVGYPFGDRLTALIGDTPSPSAPDVTVTRGSITALRTDASGDVELVQTDSTINPGTSGGPLVDADGFAVGVVVSQVTDENRNTGVGFAVPINVVKKLIDTQGLDRSLTARRLRVTQIEELLSKGVRVAMLEGRNDLSPSRVSVDLRGPDNDVSFRVDRRVLNMERSGAPAMAARRARARTRVLLRAAASVHGRRLGPTAWSCEWPRRLDWSGDRIGLHDRRSRHGETHRPLHRCDRTDCVQPERGGRCAGGIRRDRTIVWFVAFRTGDFMDRRTLPVTGRARRCSARRMAAGAKQRRRV